MLIRSTLRGGLALAATLSLFGGPLAADDDKTRDLAAFTCKDVMRLEDDDRRVLIGFLHGYLAGQTKNLQVDIAKLSDITDQFIDRCLDKPQSGAVEIFMAIPR